MPLPNSTAWRVTQMVAIFWCLLMSVSVCFCGTWTFLNNRTLLAKLIELGEKSYKTGQEKEKVDFIKMVWRGAMGLMGATMIVGVTSSMAIICEKRWSAIVFCVVNVILFVCTTVFGTMAIVSAKANAVEVTKTVFIDGVAAYSKIDLGEDGAVKNALSRYLVDHIQIQGKCCGYNSYKDYPTSGHLNVSIITGGKQLTGKARVCLQDSPTNCTAQVRPMSCCVCKQSAQRFDPLCATNKPKSDSEYHATGCIKKLDGLDHVQLLFFYGMVNIMSAFMACVLAALLVLLAWKTAPVNRAISKEIQHRYDVDSQKAAKMLQEAKEPSMGGSSRDSNRSFSQSFDGEPARVSSARLAPRNDSYRRPPENDRRGTRRGSSGSSVREDTSRRMGTNSKKAPLPKPSPSSIRRK